MILLAFLLALVIFAVAFAITVAIFLYQSKKSGNKLQLFYFIGVLFLIALVVRLICVASVNNWALFIDPNNFGTALVRSFELLYVTAGGMTFEGQEFEGDLIATAFYHVAILWLAVTYIFIITIGINYEFNSRLRLFLYRNHISSFFTKIANIFRHEENKIIYKKDEIYIFTAITEDALILARSIENKCEEERIKPVIIFAGYEINPYDKENDLHREIMMNGYYYQSYFKAKINEKEKPVISLLKLKRHRNHGHPLGAILNKKIRVFSLGNDDKEFGLESGNSDVVFRDIEALINDEFLTLKLKKNELPTQELKLLALTNAIQNNIDISYEDIEEKITRPALGYITYYVLSNSVINYEFYDKKLLRILRETFELDILDRRIYIDNNKKVRLLKEPDVSFIEDNKEEIESAFINIKSRVEEEVKKAEKEGRKYEIKTDEEYRKDIINSIFKRYQFVLDYFKLSFQTRVINEAHLAGDDLVRQRNKIANDSILRDVEMAKENPKDQFYPYPLNRVKFLRNEDGSLKDHVLPASIKEVLKNAKDVPDEEKDDYYIQNIESINENETKFIAMFLGFGQTGQSAFNNLFVDTTSVEPALPQKGENLDRFIPSRFVAQIFDSKISESIGVFAQTHPSYLIKRVHSKNRKNDKFFNLDTLKEDFYDNDAKTKGHFAEIDELLKFPFLYAYDKNCKDIEFLDEVDNTTGDLEKTFRSTIGKVNAIVVALGNDEANITVANAIIQNIRQELYHRNTNDYAHQTIFINIRNEMNLERLNWRNDIDELSHYGVYVRTFGSRERMYSYDSIIEEKEEIKINRIYNVVGDFIGKQFDALDWNVNKEQAAEVNKMLLDKDIQADILSKLNSGDEKIREQAERDYLLLIDYKKASNRSARMFATYYKTFVNKIGIENLNNDYQLAKYLSNVEHIRWCRFNFVNGSVYSRTFKANKKSILNDSNKYSAYLSNGIKDVMDYSKGFLKLHDCLLPTSYKDENYLSHTSEAYDYANVIFPSLLD